MADQKDQKKPNQSIPPYMKAISGSIGGTVEACCLQPIDVIKTRLQLDRSGAYKGIVHCGTTVARTEGVRALWKGLTPFATHLTLKYALRMGSNAMFQTALKDSETGKLSNAGRVFSGFGAGVLEALVIVTPFEVSHLVGFWHLRQGYKRTELLALLVARLLKARPCLVRFVWSLSSSFRLAY